MIGLPVSPLLPIPVRGKRIKFLRGKTGGRLELSIEVDSVRVTAEFADILNDKI